MQDINWEFETREIVKKINVDLNNVNDKFKFIFVSDSLTGIFVSGKYFDYHITTSVTHIIDKQNKSFFCRCSSSGTVSSLAHMVNEFIYPSILNAHTQIFDSNKEREFKALLLNYICDYNNKYNITHMQNKFNHYSNLLLHIERESLFGKIHTKKEAFSYPDILNLNSEHTLFEVDSSLTKSGLLSTVEFLSLTYDTNPSDLKKFIKKQLETKNNTFRIKS